MKKYVIKSEISHMPIVDMATGRVVARSYSPYFNKKTLSFEYLALSINDDGNENMFIPFSSLGFINDVCTMINLPEDRYIPDRENCFSLIGTSLTAKIGDLSLFEFGSIAQADVDENGNVISLTMNDGHSFPISRDGASANLSVNDAFASEVFSSMNVTRKSESSSLNKNDTVLINPALQVQKEEKVTEISSDVSKEEFVQRKAEPETVTVKTETASKAEVKTAPAVETKVDPITEKAEKTTDTSVGSTVKNASKPKFKFKLFSRYRKYVAPIVAMLIFFVLYCLMQYYVIKSNANWG